MAVAARTENLACLIVARNLGDAVIQSRFLQSLAAGGYARGYIAWTRPQTAFLFRDIPECEVVASQFPVGTQKQFGPAAAAGLLAAAWHIRRRRISVTLDLIGDMRERLFARLAGSPRLIHIGWAPDHPFSRLIRNPLGSGRPQVEVPASVPNIYDAYDLMLASLVPGASMQSAPAPRAQEPTGRPLRVGIHPFASQECKLWPAGHWRELVRELLAQQATVYAFGAPSDRPALLELLGELVSQVQVATESLQQFADRTATLDVMVGLDSFSTHMAARQGVRSVTINAGNPPELWAVPRTGRTVWSSGGCSSFPCFNVPKCEATPLEYACVRSIAVRQVIESINS